MHLHPEGWQQQRPALCIAQDLIEDWLMPAMHKARHLTLNTGVPPRHTTQGLVPGSLVIQYTSLLQVETPHFALGARVSWKMRCQQSRVYLGSSAAMVSSHSEGAADPYPPKGGGHSCAMPSTLLPRPLEICVYHVPDLFSLDSLDAQAERHSLCRWMLLLNDGLHSHPTQTPPAC